MLSPSNNREFPLPCLLNKRYGPLFKFLIFMSTPNWSINVKFHDSNLSKAHQSLTSRQLSNLFAVQRHKHIQSNPIGVVEGGQRNGPRRCNHRKKQRGTFADFALQFTAPISKKHDGFRCLCHMYLVGWIPYRFCSQDEIIALNYANIAPRLLGVVHKRAKSPQAPNRQHQKWNCANIGTEIAPTSEVKLRQHRK